MRRILRHALASVLAASIGAAQGRLVAIPESTPSPELVRQVHTALDLKAEPLRLHFGESAPEGAVLLDKHDLAWLWDRELADRMVASEALVLSGGTFLEWYDALLSDGRRVRFTGGLFDALRKGTDVIGCGGAAAFLSRGTSIPGDHLEAREDSRPRNPRRRSSQRPVVGLGLGPPGYIDALAFVDGSPARLMHALDETHIDLGWWIEPNTALLYDYPSSSVFVVGSGKATLLDLRRARRKREATYGARLSVLVAGEGWQRRKRLLLIPSGLRPCGSNLDATESNASALAAADLCVRDFLPAPPAAYSGRLVSDADTAWAGPNASPRPLRLLLDWHHPITEQRHPNDSSSPVAEDPDVPR